jgi:hypothetical protein
MCALAGAYAFDRPPPLVGRLWAFDVHLHVVVRACKPQSMHMNRRLNYQGAAVCSQQGLQIREERKGDEVVCRGRSGYD